MPEVTFELYTLIHASGADAETFLQGQLTQDIASLDGVTSRRAAICNPKGRVIVTMTVGRLPDGIGMAVPADMADAILGRLKMYRLRAKVDLEAGDGGWEVLVPAGEQRLADLIRSGIPFIGSALTEAFTPHMLNLDRLGAISFSKGCYTGQEVVARTEHLGKSRRRLMRYRAASPGLRPGERLTDGGSNAGDVVNVDGRDLLAVTPVDLHERTLDNGGNPVVPQGLPYEI